jgi:hypothetical protein
MPILKLLLPLLVQLRGHLGDIPFSNDIVTFEDGRCLPAALTNAIG